LSVITAPYSIDGHVIGTLGVIGPTRMAYERVIPIVDITARLLSSALSHHPSERSLACDFGPNLSAHAPMASVFHLARAFTTRPRVGVVLVNLGTPEAPTGPAIRKYLREFLSDPRVIEIPKFCGGRF
jgi:hypothetical protein